MAFMMFQFDTCFVLRKNNLRGALKALKTLKGKETTDADRGRQFMWIGDSNDFMDKDNLNDALSVWRWNIVDVDEKGNVLDIEFTGEHYGDEDILFSVLAPYVEPGSFIVMSGEDGIIWRWFFNKQKVEKQFARLVFDGQALEEVKKECKTRDGGWPHFGE